MLLLWKLISEWGGDISCQEEMEPGLSGWDLEPDGDWGEVEAVVRWEETGQVPDREENVSVLPAAQLLFIRLGSPVIRLPAQSVEPEW